MKKKKIYTDEEDESSFFTQHMLVFLKYRFRNLQFKSHGVDAAAAVAVNGVKKNTPDCCKAESNRG